MRRSTCNTKSIWTGGLLALVIVVALPGGAAPEVSCPPGDAQDKLLTLNFVDADIVDVVKALATQSGANVVVAGSVSGEKITLSLHEVTLEQALRLVTQPNGLDYRRIDGSYVVAPPADLANYPTAGFSVTRSVTFTNLPFEQVQTIVTDSVPGVKVSGAKGSRTVVLTAGSDEAIDQAAALLAEIDRQPARPTTKVVVLKRITPTNATKMLAEAMPTIQVAQGPADGTLLLTGLPIDVVEAAALIEAADVTPGIGATQYEVYEIRYGEPEELMEKVAALVPDVQVMLGPKTVTPMLRDPSAGGGSGTSFLEGPMTVASGGYSSTGGAGGTSGIEVAPVTTLILAGPPDAIGRAKQLLAAIDVASPMISIAALVAEGNVSDISRKGIDWTGLGESAPATSITEESGLDSMGNPTGDAANFFKIGRISRSVFDINATLRALIDENRLRVLSRPNIVALNGRQATLHSGQTVFYRKQVGIDDRGFPIFDIEQIPVGVTLIINPRMAPDGEIILTLQPIVSSLSANPWFPDLPLVSEHRTLTTVRIKQGEVLVIAGLMRDTEEVTKSRVPLLGDLPLIGPLLFQHKHKRKISTELMIFIEPVPVQYPTDVEVMKPAQ